ncbi:unnamed protein product [Adineta steineri]|uniref:Uncharacterized protein n=1 Tax=Adineta steineri TaxID=433720 RepID=A0A813VJA0_9BILA|nr:unnamed protein product [Adineta steineri]CAF1123449.1 unnamed protein product [Adineta steineri]
MSQLSIVIGKDRIQGKLIGLNRWEFWFGSKKFMIDSSNTTDDAVEVLLMKSTILKGKELHPNIWTVEYSFYGSSAWGSVSIWYNFEFNIESMKAIIKSETNTDA